MGVRICALLVLLALLLPASVHAQDENRAGLVIVHGDGNVVQQCVSFGEESISGYDLLSRAGLPLSVEAGGFGTTVCSIGGEGCSYPTESCFCQCQGSPCVYWSYWRLQDDGAWRYQPLGAGNTQVQDGAVEAWRWAAGTTRDAPAPPPASFNDICGATDTLAVAPPITQAPPSAQSPATLTTTMQSSPGTAVESSLTFTAVPTATGHEDVRTGQQLWLLLAGAVVLPAAVLLFWALLRRGR